MNYKQHKRFCMLLFVSLLIGQFSDVNNNLQETNNIVPQYEWLAEYAKENNIIGLEMGIEKLLKNKDEQLDNKDEQLEIESTEEEVMKEKKQGVWS